MPTADIARKVGVSQSTVNRIIAELKAAKAQENPDAAN